MKKNVILITVLMTVISVFAISCANPHKDILGKWSHTDTVLEVIATEETYEFFEDGTGKITAALGITWDFTYIINDDAEKITITTTALNKNLTTEYSYVFGEETLILTSGGKSIVLYRLPEISVSHPDTAADTSKTTADTGAR